MKIYFTVYGNGRMYLHLEPAQVSANHEDLRIPCYVEVTTMPTLEEAKIIVSRVALGIAMNTSNKDAVSVELK